MSTTTAEETEMQSASAADASAATSSSSDEIQENSSASSKMDANDYSRFNNIDEDNDSDGEKKTDVDSDDDLLNAMSVEEAIFKANASKEQGNNAFKANDITLARVHYSEGLAIIQKKQSKAKDLPETQSKEVHLLTVALNGNMAMVEAKQENWAKSLQYSIAVLKLDSSNIKALFRKGQACGKLGNYEQAKFELQKVLEVDPSNAAAKKELADVTKLMKEQAKKDKVAYSSMFAKGSMYEDREKERQIKLQKEKEQKEKEQDMWSQSKLERREKGLPEQSFDEWKKELDDAKKKEEKKSPPKIASKPKIPKPVRPAGSSTDTDYDEEDEKIIKEATSKGYCYFKKEQSNFILQFWFFDDNFFGFRH
jgi:tetratricopeptide (TPR) repeat protein